MLLSAWQPRRNPERRDCRVYIVPRRTVFVDCSEMAKEIDATQASLEAMSADDLHTMWRIRNNVDRQKQYKWRQLLWMELQRRYTGVLTKPLHVELPYTDRLTVRKRSRRGCLQR